VSSTWFDISCTLSGAHTAVVSGGGSSYTLDPDSDFAAGDDCTVTLYGAQIADQDELPQTMAEDYAWSFGAFAICGDPATAIHDIQGSGNASPLVGNYRTIEGVVVGDFQGPTGGASAELNGFFVQEEEAQYDSDSATSEGIFVFEGGSAVNVNVGDVVRVRGPIAEFNFGSGGDAGNANGQTLTQLGTVSSISVCSSANLLPAAYGLDLPVDPAFIYESIEGMYVSTVEDLVATEVFWLGRYGQVLLSSGDRLWQPTNIYPAGPDTDALTLANALNSVYIDDDTNAQNPADNPYLYTLGPDDQTLRIGATTGAFFGVLDYMESFGHNVYALRPVGGIPAFTPGNDRPAAPTFPDADVTVASFNVLNYFNGDGLGGGFPTSRGASTPLEFTRQRDKIITAITALDASVVGLMEIENDAPPYSAIEDLVAGLNAATASGTYAFVDTGVVGTDAIKVGIIYQPADVTPVGNWATITTGTFANRSRPPIAQAFRHEATGEIFVVVVNHFKSKGCDGATGADTDQGDGQSCWNALRVQSAQELAAWLATDPTGTGDSDVLIIGDLNSYLQEDPILTLESLGYTNLLEQLIGDHAYTYVFDGRAGVLDHALASPSIAGNVLGIAPWHINADEPSVIDYDMNFKPPSQQDLYTATPYRSSDHDPVLVALDFAAPTHVSFPLVIGHQEFTCDFTDTRSDGCFFRFDYTTPTNKSAWLTDLRVWSDSTRSTLLTGYSLVEEYRGASNHLRQYDVTFRDWQLFGFTIDGGATVPDAPFSFEVYTPVYFEVRLGTGATCDLIRGWYDPVAQTVTILEVTACLP
jgi:predicted extracellular nuclease